MNRSCSGSIKKNQERYFDLKKKREEILYMVYFKDCFSFLRVFLLEGRKTLRNEILNYWKS